MKNFNNIIQESILDDDAVNTGLDKALQDKKIEKLLTEYPVYKAKCDMTGRELHEGNIVVFYPPKQAGNELQFGIIKKVTAKRATLYSADRLVKARFSDWNSVDHNSNTISLDTCRMFIVGDVTDINTLLEKIS